MRLFSRTYAPCLLVAALALSPLAAGAAQEVVAADLNPEAATVSHIESRPVVRAPRYMVSAANPLATAAGVEMLEQGGSVIDAAIAAQPYWGWWSRSHRGSGVVASLWSTAQAIPPSMPTMGAKRHPLRPGPTAF